MKVLIIDDNPINVKLLDKLVTKINDCEPQSFTSSAAALRWSGDHYPDLVFVDYMMPAPDGLEFIEAFKELPGKKDVPIVMITADSDKEIRYKALKLGANDFLSKPIDNSELIARTKNMLTIRRNQKELESRADWLSHEVKKATQEILTRESETIFRLSRAAEYRSPETGLHVMRVALYSRAIARQIGLSHEEQELIFMAVPMHDVGKVATPDQILFKKGKLDIYEFAQIKLHTLSGYEIMQNSNSKLLQIASEIALSHHEKYDGTGYPRGLKGDRIPLAARICTISDVFDALTSERSYKNAWTVEEAVAEIESKSGSYFDPGLVKAFREIKPEIIEIKNKFCGIKPFETAEELFPCAQ